MNTIPTKEDLTNQQLGPILAVIRELQPFILDDVAEEGGTPSANRMAGEVALAAQTTFIKACSRIDTVLEDSSRWDLKDHHDVIGELVKSHKAQQKLLASQTAAAEMLRKPHYLLRPNVAVAGNSYIAFWGDLEKPGCYLCGSGKSPRAALEDFDKAFDRAPEEQVAVIAEQAGVDLTKTKPPTE